MVAMVNIQVLIFSALIQSGKAMGVTHGHESSVRE